MVKPDGGHYPKENALALSSKWWGMDPASHGISGPAPKAGAVVTPSGLDYSIVLNKLTKVELHARGRACSLLGNRCICFSYHAYQLTCG